MFGYGITWSTTFLRRPTRNRGIVVYLGDHKNYGDHCWRGESPVEFILRRDPETNWWADREIEEGLRCCWCVKPGRCDIWKLFEGKWTFWSFLPDPALLTIPARVFHVCCPRSSVMFFPLRCARSSEPFVRISQ